ncbi:MAG: hypothetical protein MUC92_08645 [Fimbriimonadaceae bacterium]|jgi:hypothetical protein|nr:hypothetical protein [Fimbriimonadaceae bacterium]
MMQYAILEWDYSEEALTLTLPNHRPKTKAGNISLVSTWLNDLGEDGWEVVGNVAAEEWIMWTLARKRG